MTLNRIFSIRSFYRFLIDQGRRCRITPRVFKNFFPCKINSLSLMWDSKILTLDNLVARRCNLLPTTTWFLCHKDIETVDRVCFGCNIAASTWHRFMHIIGFSRAPTSRSDYGRIGRRTWDPDMIFLSLF